MTSISGIIITTSITLFSLLISSETPEPGTTILTYRGELRSPTVIEPEKEIKTDKLLAFKVSDADRSIPINQPIKEKAILSKTKTPTIIPIGTGTLGNDTIVVEDLKQERDTLVDKALSDTNNIETQHPAIENANKSGLVEKPINPGIKFNNSTYKGYDKFYGFYYNDDNWAMVKVDGKYGMIDRQNSFVVQPIYDDLDECFCYNDDSWCKVKRNRKYGFIDRSGKEVVPVQYEKIWSFCENDDKWAKVKRDGKFFFLDRDGNEVVFHEPN
ncbi:MAG: WG repeat-containing protein [Bacteroidales bacterium]|nr:WG repeat-containing protein [Bacteroidales bacterium]MCF8454686.1 WG repeat-containing protein [Bacteroidales bacterium]